MRVAISLPQRAVLRQTPILLLSITHRLFTRVHSRCLNTRTRMRPSLQFVERVRPMMSRSFLLPVRCFVLATITLLLFVSEANAFRIFQVAGSSADHSSPVVKYVYPQGFQLDEPLEFSVRERNRPPANTGHVASCCCANVDVQVTLHREVRYRHRGIRVHRAAEFRRSRIRLHRAGYFHD